jgi:hypothetical protein
MENTEQLNSETKPQVIITKSTKSMGISLVLTALFGSLGMFYSTIIGAIVMLIVEAIILFVTFGFGVLLTHPICMIWGALAVKRYNKKLLGE